MKPEIEREIVISRREWGTHTLDIDVATKKAKDCVIEASEPYCTMIYSERTEKLPTSIILFISPCYNIEDIIAYLESLPITSNETDHDNFIV